MAKTKSSKQDTTPTDSAGWRQLAQQQRADGDELNEQAHTIEQDIEARIGRGSRPADVADDQEQAEKLRRRAGAFLEAAESSDREAARCDLLDRAQQRREDLARLEALQREHAALDFDRALSYLADVVRQRLEIEAEAEALQQADVRHSLFKRDVRELDAAGEIKGALIDVLPPGAFANAPVIAAGERGRPSAWRRVGRVVREDAERLETEAAEVQAAGDDGDD